MLKVYVLCAEGCVHYMLKVCVLCAEGHAQYMLVGGGGRV